MNPLRVQGVVGPGQGIATGLGCPTANLRLEEGLVIPAEGIYLGISTVDGTLYPSLACVGAGRDQNYFKIEVHLIDQKIDLQGKHLAIDLLKRTRGLVPWQNEEMMKEIIAKDMDEAYKWFEENKELIIELEK